MDESKGVVRKQLSSILICFLTLYAAAAAATETELENQGFRLCGPFDSRVLSLALILLFQVCQFHMRKYTSTVPDGYKRFTEL